MKKMALLSENVLLPLLLTDLSASKRRPVLVLKEGNAHGDFLAVQIASQTGYLPALSLIAGDSDLGGLPMEGIVRRDKVFTISASLTATPPAESVASVGRLLASIGR